MRRTIVVASCLTVLCLAVLAGWLFYLSGTGPVRPPEQQAAGNGDPARDRAVRVSGKAAAAPPIFQLPVLIAYRKDGPPFPCYYDQANKILYRWKGVVLRPDQAPDPVFTMSGRMMPDAKDYTVAPFEAPVKYLKVEGGYQPGYFDRTCHQFYGWKGLVLRKEQLLEKSEDGQDPFVQPAIPSQVISVIEIDMPAFLKGHPELWKKT